jgi:chromosome segregation ATPase
MVKKMVGIGLATVGGLALVGSVFGSEIKTYGKTGGRIIEEKIEEAAGTGAKLEVLKTRVVQLDDEVDHLRRAATSRQVELEAARAHVQEDEKAIARQRKVLSRAAELLDENRDSYEISGRTYTRAVVEEDARAKLDACASCEKSIEEEKKIVQVREKTLELARAHLDRAVKRRTELSALVRGLEARLGQMKAKRALADALDAEPLSSEVQGELAKAEKLAKEVEQKLETDDRLLDERLARKDVQGGTIDYEKPAEPKPEDTARAIRAHLNGNAPAAPASPAELH